MEVVDCLKHVEVLEAAKKHPKTYNQKIGLKIYLSQGVSPKERVPRQGRIREESRCQTHLNQKILTRNFYLRYKVTNRRYWTHNSKEYHLIKNLGNKKSVEGHMIGSQIPRNLMHW